jgi:hypothetical protein
MMTKSWANMKDTGQGWKKIIQEPEAGIIKETPIYIDERTSRTMYVRSPMDHHAGNTEAHLFREKRQPS